MFARLLAILPAAVGLLLAQDDAHPTLAVGSSAPDFTLPGIDGKIHTLTEYSSARVLAIVFTCNHFPTAQLYESRIKRIADDSRRKSCALAPIRPHDPA